MTASSIQTKQMLQSSQVQGVWNLVSYVVEVKETDESFAPMGARPTGYAIFTAKGRLSFTLTAEGRQHAPQQTSIRLAFHQPAAHQVRSDDFCGAAEEGLR